MRWFLERIVRRVDQQYYLSECVLYTPRSNVFFNFIIVIILLLFYYFFIVFFKFRAEQNVKKIKIK